MGRPCPPRDGGLHGVKAVPGCYGPVQERRGLPGPRVGWSAGGAGRCPAGLQMARNSPWAGTAVQSSAALSKGAPCSATGGVPWRACYLLLLSTPLGQECYPSLTKAHPDQTELVIGVRFLSLLLEALMIGDPLFYRWMLCSRLEYQGCLHWTSLHAHKVTTCVST